MKRIYPLLLLLITLNYVSCYEDPFFKLKVFVVDQDFNTIDGADIVISVQDEVGEIVEEATIYQTSITDYNGLASFEFDNLGFSSTTTESIWFIL